MSTQTCVWTGESGKQYKYEVCDLSANFADVDGNYAFVKLKDNTWYVLYFGQGNLKARLTAAHENWPCAKARDCTHIHAHANSNKDLRLSEESDLIAAYKPPCNTQGK